MASATAYPSSSTAERFCGPGRSLSSSSISSSSSSLPSLDDDGLRFDDQDDWPTSGLGLEGIDEDPYGTRHLESPGIIHTPSFWAQHSASTDHSSAVAVNTDGSTAVEQNPVELPQRPLLRSSVSLPPALAVRVTSSAPTAPWWPNGGQFDEFTPSPLLSPLPRPAPSPVFTPLTASPSSTPLRGRFLSLDLAPVESFGGAACSLQMPGSSPMVRSPSMPAFVDPSAVHPSQGVDAGPVRAPERAKRDPSPVKAKASLPGKKACARPSSPIKAFRPAEPVKAYKGGKSVHSCEGCRKARHKCIGANPPPAGEAGVSEDRCQRCAEKGISCVFDVLRTRGPCGGKNKPLGLVRSSTRGHAGGNSGSHGVGGREGRSSLRVACKRSSSLDAVPIMIEPVSYQPPQKAPLTERMHAEQSRNSANAIPSLSVAHGQQLRPAKPFAVEHTFIPDPVGNLPSYRTNALYHTPSMSTTTMTAYHEPALPSSSSTVTSLLDGPLAAAPVPFAVRSASGVSSGSEGDEVLPKSPDPAHGGLPPVCYGAQPCFTLAPAPAHVGIIKHSVSAAYIECPSSSAGAAEPYGYPSSLLKAAAGDDVGGYPIIAPSVWSWFGRPDLSSHPHGL